MGLKITNVADKPLVWLYGVIGDSYEGITADMFRKALAEIPTKQPIEVRIQSEGGSYFEGIAIHSLLKGRKGATSVIVDGLAASAASLVAMAGTTVEMARGSWMMIHEAHGAMHGTEKDFREHADILKAMNEQVADIYFARWKGNKTELRSAIAAETWLTAEEAVAFGLADSISNSMAIAARVDAKKFGFGKVPESLTNVELPRLKAAEEVLGGLFKETSDES